MTDSPTAWRRFRTGARSVACRDEEALPERPDQRPVEAHPAAHPAGRAGRAAPAVRRAGGRRRPPARRRRGVPVAGRPPRPAALEDGLKLPPGVRCRRPLGPPGHRPAGRGPDDARAGPGPRRRVRRQPVGRDRVRRGVRRDGRGQERPRAEAAHRHHHAGPPAGRAGDGGRRGRRGDGPEGAGRVGRRGVPAAGGRVGGRDGPQQHPGCVARRPGPAAGRGDEPARGPGGVRAAPEAGGGRAGARVPGPVRPAGSRPRAADRDERGGGRARRHSSDGPGCPAPAGPAKVPVQTTDHRATLWNRL